jgi:hypothetical protein
MQMGEVEIYNAIRSEIVTNHILIHVTTWIVVIILLVGTWVVENRKTILSVILPLLTLAWAAAVVRFDFFIHRQAAYLRGFENHLQQSGLSMPLWESWKSSLRSTAFVVPLADFLAVLVIVLPTIYLLFIPAQEFFHQKRWRGGKLYAWVILILIGLLLGLLLFIPKIAQT